MERVLWNENIEIYGWDKQCTCCLMSGKLMSRIPHVYLTRMVCPGLCACVARFSEYYYYFLFFLRYNMKWEICHH